MNGPIKNIGQSMSQQMGQLAGDFKQEVLDETKQTVASATSQIGLKPGVPQEVGTEQVTQGQQSGVLPQLPAKPQPFDSVAYRQNMEEESRQKLAILRQRLAEIQNEIQVAGVERQQEQAQYIQSQQEMMDRTNQPGGVVDENTPQEPVAPPPSVKARTGTGEVSKRSFKG